MDTQKSNKHLGLDSFNFNSVNPFINEVVIHITENKNSMMASAIGSKEVLDPQTGQLKTENVLFLKKAIKITDHQEYCKIYFGAFKHFFNLPNSAVDVLDYIMRNIQYGSDRVCLHVATVADEVGLTKAAIYKALVRLLSANIIARADRQNCYFINPSMLFKGERISLIKEYINVSGEKFDSTTKRLVKGKYLSKDLPSSENTES